MIWLEALGRAVALLAIFVTVLCLIDRLSGGHK